jgi:hypothetical protein
MSFCPRLGRMRERGAWEGAQSAAGTWRATDAYSEGRREAGGWGDGESFLQQGARLGAVRRAGGLDEGDCAAEVETVAA